MSADTPSEFDEDGNNEGMAGNSDGALVADQQRRIKEWVQSVVMGECEDSLSESDHSAVTANKTNFQSAFNEGEVAGERLLQTGDRITTSRGTLTVWQPLNVVFRRQGSLIVAAAPELGEGLVASGTSVEHASEALFLLILRTYARLMLRDSIKDKTHPIFKYFFGWRRTSEQIGE